MCAVAQSTSEHQEAPNFRESPKGEVRRILILGSRVNKGKKEGGGADVGPWPYTISSPSTPEHRPAPQAQKDLHKSPRNDIG
jgi:hypothetical protein